MNKAEAQYAELADQARCMATMAPNWEISGGWISIAGAFRELATLHRRAVNHWMQRDDPAPATE
jgi:hypothetical protein